MEHKIWNTDYGIRIMEYELWNTDYGIQNMECGIFMNREDMPTSGKQTYTKFQACMLKGHCQRILKHGIWNTELRIRNTEYGIWNTEY